MTDSLGEFVAEKTEDQPVYSIEDLVAEIDALFGEVSMRVRRYRRFLNKVARSDHPLATEAQSLLEAHGDEVEPSG